jgi:hypothetical protein
MAGGEMTFNKDMKHVMGTSQIYMEEMFLKSKSIVENKLLF